MNFRRRTIPGRGTVTGWFACSGTTKAILTWAVLLMIPLLVQWPNWSGWVTSNPLYEISGLTSAVRVPLRPLAGYPYTDLNAGVTTQALGALAAHDWLHGVVPWWNPYTGIGLPLAGEMQPAAFFLPFLFLVLLPHGVLCLKIAMQLIAGGGTFVLLRQLGMARWAALTGGILFELNGTFAWVAHAPILPIAFLPLLLIGIERAAHAAGNGESRGWRWITIALAYALLAGFPEVAYLDGLFALTWALWRLWGLPRRVWLAFIGKLALGGSLALLIAAPLLVAFGDFLQQGYVGGHLSFAHRGLVSPNLSMLLIPYIAGTVGGHLFWFYLGGYLGLTVVFLAILALLRPTGGNLPRIPLAIWVLITFAKAIDLPGITWVLNKVPLVRFVMFPNYVAPSWSMAVIVLAVFALDDWWRGLVRPRAVLAAMAGTAVLLAAALLSEHHVIGALWRENPLFRMMGRASLAWSVLLLAGLALCVSLRPTAARRSLIAAVMAFDAFVLFSVPTLSGHRPEPLDVSAVSFLQRTVGLRRILSIGALQQNYGAFFRIPSITYNYLPNVSTWVNYARNRLDPAAGQVSWSASAAALQARLPDYEALGVGYVMVPRRLDPKVGRLVFRGPTMDVYALPDPAPYFAAAPGTCRLQATGRDSVTAECDSPATLVRRELFLPGWQALAGGRPLELRRYDDVLQAVRLPAGATHVQFRFVPPYMGWATGAFVVGIMGFLLSFVPAPRFGQKSARRLQTLRSAPKEPG